MTHRRSSWSLACVALLMSVTACARVDPPTPITHSTPRPSLIAVYLGDGIVRTLTPTDAVFDQAWAVVDDAIESVPATFHVDEVLPIHPGYPSFEQWSWRAKRAVTPQYVDPRGKLGAGLKAFYEPGHWLGFRYDDSWAQAGFAEQARLLGGFGRRRVPGTGTEYHVRFLDLNAPDSENARVSGSEPWYLMSVEGSKLTTQGYFGALLPGRTSTGYYDAYRELESELERQ